MADTFKTPELSDDELRIYARGLVVQAGSLAQAARALKVTATEIGRFLHGRQPAKSVVKALGYEPIRRYQRKEKP